MAKDKDKEKVMANARKIVAYHRDELGKKSEVSSSKDWTIGGLFPVKAPFDFNVWYVKKDGQPGKWYGSFYRVAESWFWLNNNAMIMQLPTGGRLESPHRTNFFSEVIQGSGGTVTEKKAFVLDELVDEMVKCFDQDENIQVRVGYSDFVVSPLFMAYVIATKELVDKHTLAN